MTTNNVAYTLYYLDMNPWCSNSCVYWCMVSCIIHFQEFLVLLRHVYMPFWPYWTRVSAPPWGPPVSWRPPNLLNCATNWSIYCVPTRRPLYPHWGIWGLQEISCLDSCNTCLTHPGSMVSTALSHDTAHHKSHDTSHYTSLNIWQYCKWSCTCLKVTLCIEDISLNAAWNLY